MVGISVKMAKNKIFRKFALLLAILSSISMPIMTNGSSIECGKSFQP